MKDKIYVWDIFVRVFHWSLVAAFVLSYVTGEDETDVHVYSGYVIVGLLILRVIWGFIGTRYARFSNFVTRPSVVMNYLKNIRNEKATRYIGHNPAGGYMVLALLLSLSVTTFSGMKFYGSQGHGPLANNSAVSQIKMAQADSDRDEQEKNENEDHVTVQSGDQHDKKEKKGDKFWKEIHELFVNFTLLLVIVHIAGVVVSSRLHHENLARAMLSGYKEK